MSETKATGRGRKVGRIIGRTMAIIGTTLAAVFISLYSMLWIFCHGPSKSARNLFVSTILETGALKFLAGWYFDDEEILEITSNNNMIHNDNEVDTDLIDIPDNKGDEEDDKPDTPEEEGFDENGMIGAFCVVMLFITLFVFDWKFVLGKEIELSESFVLFSL